MIYVVVNSSKNELPTAKMYFSDIREHISVARPSSAIQVLERIHREDRSGWKFFIVTSVTFGKHEVS